jgi:predicted DsbA family dithiol-disulfide isomerase
MHDSLLSEQDTWLGASDPGVEFEGYAESLGLDATEFAECLESDRAKLRVQSGNVLASLYGIPGAPIFLFSTGTSLEGSPTFEEMESMIESGLNQ